MTRPERDASIDLLRGIVMILMVLDHARDFFSPTAFAPVDPDKTTVALFATRWITHFCAPVFVFLAGTSAWLHQRNRALDSRELSRFLAVRGLWLVALELLVVNPSWNFSIGAFAFLQVIWAIGVAMLVLAVLVRGPRWLPLAFGLLLVLGHDLLDPVAPATFGSLEWAWRVLHVQSFIELGPDAGIFIAYPLIPWVGVIALGYALGPWIAGDRRRNAVLIGAGVAMLALFVALRLPNVYGDPVEWTSDPRGPLWTFLRVMNVSKYPPSLLYLLATLGPAAIALALLSRVRGAWSTPVATFGRVPLFFYLLHLPLLHLGAVIWAHAAFGRGMGGADGPPPGYEPSLARCYLAWIVALVALYPVCRWYDRYKRAHPQNRLLQLL
jgi:uncharacterized membrane protein